ARNITISLTYLTGQSRDVPQGAIEDCRLVHACSPGLPAARVGRSRGKRMTTRRSPPWRSRRVGIHWWPKTSGRSQQTRSEGAAAGHFPVMNRSRTISEADLKRCALSAAVAPPQTSKKMLHPIALIYDDTAWRRVIRHLILVSGNRRNAPAWSATG